MKPTELLHIVGLVATAASVAATCPYRYGPNAPKCTETPKPRETGWWTEIDWWPESSGSWDTKYIQQCSDKKDEYKCLMNEAKTTTKCIDLRTDTPCTTTKPNHNDWWALDPEWPDAFANNRTLPICTGESMCLNKHCLDGDGKSACTNYDTSRPKGSDTPSPTKPTALLPDKNTTYSMSGVQIEAPGVYFGFEGDMASTGSLVPSDLINSVRAQCQSPEGCATAGNGEGVYCIDTTYPAYDGPVDWKACLTLNGYVASPSIIDLQNGDGPKVVNASWDILKSLVDDSSGWQDLWVFAQWTNRGVREDKEVKAYGIPRKIHYALKTESSSLLYVNMEFKAYQVLKGCATFDKVNKWVDVGATAASTVAMGPLQPLGLIAGIASLPFKFASFLAGCESIKPTGWPKVMTPGTYEELRTRRAWTSRNSTLRWDSEQE